MHPYIPEDLKTGILLSSELLAICKDEMLELVHKYTTSCTCGLFMILDNGSWDDETQVVARAVLLDWISRDLFHSQLEILVDYESKEIGNNEGENNYTVTILKLAIHLLKHFQEGSKSKSSTETSGEE